MGYDTNIKPMVSIVKSYEIPPFSVVNSRVFVVRQDGSSQDKHANSPHGWRMWLDTLLHPLVIPHWLVVWNSFYFSISWE